MCLYTLRSVGFTGDASEAVHYALHYLGDLVKTEDRTKRPSRVSCDQILHPHLQLPDVFELLHHGNQVTPMFILESVVGKLFHQKYVQLKGSFPDSPSPLFNSHILKLCACRIFHICAVYERRGKSLGFKPS